MRNLQRNSGRNANRGAMVGSEWRNKSAGWVGAKVPRSPDLPPSTVLPPAPPVLTPELEVTRISLRAGKRHTSTFRVRPVFGPDGWTVIGYGAVSESYPRTEVHLNAPRWKVSPREVVAALIAYAGSAVVDPAEEARKEARRIAAEEREVLDEIVREQQERNRAVREAVAKERRVQLARERAKRAAAKRDPFATSAFTMAAGTSFTPA